MLVLPKENVDEKSVYYSVYANLVGGCSVFFEEEEFDYDEDEEEIPEIED